jgi:hypothetical protein
MRERVIARCNIKFIACGDDVRFTEADPAETSVKERWRSVVSVSLYGTPEMCHVILCLRKTY